MTHQLIYFIRFLENLIFEKILESSSKRSFWNISSSWSDSVRFMITVSLIRPSWRVMNFPDDPCCIRNIRKIRVISDLLDFDPRRPKISKTSFDMNKDRWRHRQRIRVLRSIVYKRSSSPPSSLISTQFRAKKYNFDFFEKLETIFRPPKWINLDFSEI